MTHTSRAAYLDALLPQSADYIRILPEIVLSIFGMIVMMLDPVLDERHGQKDAGHNRAARQPSPASPAHGSWRNLPGLAFWNMVRVDGFSIFFHALVIAIAAVVILSSHEYMEVQRIRAGEYYALILFGTVGMALMSSAVELVLIFIALEISSISTYILAGFRRTEAASARIVTQIFPAGFVRHRIFPLWRGADVRRDRLHQHRPDQPLLCKLAPMPLLAYVAVAL